MLGFSSITFCIAATALAYLCCAIVLRLTESTQGCTVIITGESVKIVGCVFTESFIEYAKGLQPARHW